MIGRRRWMGGVVFAKNPVFSVIKSSIGVLRLKMAQIAMMVSGRYISTLLRSEQLTVIQLGKA